jgi:peptide-methionine (R)-S-oxide reductase
MFRTSLRLWGGVSVLAAVVLLSSLAATAQDPFQDAVKSANEPTDRAKPESGRDPDKADTAKAKPKAEPEFVNKTDAEWRKVLTRAQFAVTREKMTEPAFSGRYATGHFRGTFLCVCCKAELFSALHKFDSGTGWPSFFRPMNEKSLQTAIDDSAGEPRMEVMCRRCGAHLGHVFNDGPPPTGLRFCINSLSLVLRRPDASLDAAASTQGSKKSTAKSTMRSTAKTKPASRPKSTAKPAPPGNESPDPAPPAAPAAARVPDATSPAGPPL